MHILSATPNLVVELTHETILLGANANTNGNVTNIDHPAINDRPELKLFLSHELSGNYIKTFGVFYSGGQWRIFNEDRSPIIAGLKFHVLAYEPGDNVFNHTSSSINIVGNRTRIDHPQLNDVPAAKLVVTHDWTVGREYQDKRVGVWYDGSRWTIYNQDRSTMDVDVNYNVLFDTDGMSILTHETDPTNIIPEFRYTQVDHPNLNGLPGLHLVATHDFDSNGPYLDAHLAIWYAAGKWNLVQDGEDFVPGQRFHILVGRQSDEPDLIPSTLDVPVSACVGEDIGPATSLVVSNQGGSNAGAFSVAYYLSTDTILDSQDVILTGGQYQIGSLNTEESATVPAFENKIPTGVLPGDYYLFVVVDDLENIDESLELNNKAYKAISITRCPAVVEWNTPAPIVYGAALGNQELNASATIAGTYVYNPPSGSEPDAGPQLLKVTFTPDDQQRYSATTKTVELTVTPALLTIRADDKSRFVGQPNPPLTTTYSGFVRGDNVGSLDTLPVLSVSVTLDSDPGDYPITVTGGSDANYTIDRIDGTLTILSKAILRVVAEDKVMFEGSEVPPLTLRYSGFLGEDSASSLLKQPTVATVATPQSVVGTYPITVSEGSDSRYELILEGGTIHVLEPQADAVDAISAGSTIFDGACSIVYPHEPRFTESIAMTVEAWVWREDIDSCETIVGNNRTQSMWFGTCPNLRFYRSGNLYADSSIQVPEGIWTHVAASYDGEHVTFFLNGVKIDRRSLAHSGLGGENPLYLGEDVGALKFHGRLDEVRLWNYARKEGEINRMMAREVFAEEGLSAVFHDGGAREGLLGSRAVSSGCNASADHALEGELSDEVKTLIQETHDLLPKVQLRKRVHEGGSEIGVSVEFQRSDMFIGGGKR